MATITVDPNILAQVNAATTATIQDAVAILRANSIFDPTTIATYLAQSRFGTPSGTPAPAQAAASSGTSFSTIFGMLTPIGMIGGMLKVGGNIMAIAGTGFLAGFLQYKVFSSGITAGEDDTGGNIAKLGMWFAAAVAATMLWLSRFNNPNTQASTDSSSIITRLMLVIKTGHFSIIPTDPAFWYTVAVATAITSAILAAGVIMGTQSGDGAPVSTNDSLVASMASQVGHWYDSLPSAAVVAVVGGLTIGNVSYNLTPGTSFHQFTVNTVDLAGAVPSANGTSGGGIVPSVLYSAGAGPNGSDVVYVVSPNSDGTSTIDEFAVDKNGYVIGPNGPATNYLPFFQPKVVNGQVTGVIENTGALNAIQQIPACSAIANNTTMSATDREAALETCMRANKNVTFVPTN